MGGFAELVQAFGAAAGRAAAAGFDGIHIHGGNGYLISEFCSPHANTRDDDWGGDAERRSRFMVAVYDAVRSAAGEGFPITARLSVEDSVPDGLQGEESLQRAAVLAERGIDGFETTYGVMRSYFENIRPYVAVGRAQAWRNLLVQRARHPAGAEAYYRPFARATKEATGLPIILVGGVRTTRDDDGHPRLRRRRLPGNGPPVHPGAGSGPQAGGGAHRRRRSACRATCALRTTASTRSAAGARAPAAWGSTSESTTGPTVAAASEVSCGNFDRPPVDPRVSLHVTLLRYITGISGVTSGVRVVEAVLATADVGPWS